MGHHFGMHFIRDDRLSAQGRKRNGHTGQRQQRLSNDHSLPPYLCMSGCAQLSGYPILTRAGLQPATSRYLQMADKAQRTLAMLTERLDRHRGAGQQQITVKHVTVNADNAIVGDVNHAPGVGPSAEIEGQPHALGHAIQPTLWSENPQRESVLVASDAERTLPDARGAVSRRPERE